MRLRPTLLLGLFVLTVARAAPSAPDPWNSPNARALLEHSLQFAEPLWDERAGFLWAATRASWAYSSTERERRHSVRESAWYALGLFMRRQPGDDARAVRILSAVLEEQAIAPGQPWAGTFYRNPEEPHPPTGARRWDDYDPNWRQFIGTTLALCLIHFEDRLPAGMPARIERALAAAIEGEQTEHRLTPNYTNIALMHAFLWAYAGERLGRPEWVRQADAWAEEVHAGFVRYGAFEEYNSPTYYGVDLFGLALWRRHGPTARLRSLGAEMEAALWRDIAMFYHPGLRNLAGPYDRAYGMDLTRYASLLGPWIGLAVPADRVPLPVPDSQMGQAHDYLGIPLIVILGAEIPTDARARLLTFEGEHQVTRQITSWRTATAWLGENVMLGGEQTSRQRAAGTPHNQFHPATIHWQLPGGRVGWILLQKASRLNARASANFLVIDAIGNATFRFFAPGATPAALTRAGWNLPALAVQVDTDAREFTVRADGDFLEATYTEATRFALRTTYQPAPASR